MAAIMKDNTTPGPVLVSVSVIVRVTNSVSVSVLLGQIDDKLQSQTSRPNGQVALSSMVVAQQTHTKATRHKVVSLTGLMAPAEFETKSEFIRSGLSRKAARRSQVHSSPAAAF